MNETTPIPIQQASPQMSEQSYLQMLQQQAEQQRNTAGLTQMAPNTAGATPPAQRQFKDPGQQSVSAVGVGEKGAHQRESMQNLVKASQSFANQIGKQIQDKQNREYEQTITRFTGATQGLAQSQAQIVQATAALKKDPNDQTAQAQLKQAQGSLQQNQAILNDLATDKKHAKTIMKAFGIDDKNKDTPERQAAIEAIKKQQGVGQQAAQLQSGIPSTQQLSPQAQQQQQARQAGVVGAPATQGQVLNAYSKMYDTSVKAGMTREKLDIEMNKRGLTFKTDENGERLYNEDGSPQLRPMTEEEVKQNPITKAQIDYKEAQTAAQKAAAESKTDPNNPELKIKATDAAARMLSAQASMLRAQKYVPGGAGGAGGGVDIKELSKEMREGKLAPSELPGFGKVRAEVFAQAHKDDPNFSPAMAEQQYKFSNNPAIQRQMATINSLNGFGDEKGSLGELQSLSTKLKRTSFPPVNSVEMQALIASGDPDAAAYASVATDVADQIGVIMSSGGSGASSSDFKLRQAQAVLSSKFSPKQLNSIIGELKVLMGNRQKAFIAQGGPFLKAQMNAASGDASGGGASSDASDPMGVLK